MRKLTSVALAAVAISAGVLMIGTEVSAKRYRGGAACPPGYDGSRGYCVANRDYDGRRYRRDRRDRYWGDSYGAACPPGYDGRSGRCYPNR